ncbi:phosphoribosyltransferase [Bacteroides sp. 41_26]|uniref:phosphoribosyltransferase n=1 Tax=Bacteroides sp. 41_26 TaxID=1896973 RepID=UPI00259CFA17|nr:phosphoribosyltransferase [Bacteroides sp. 41_26]
MEAINRQFRKFMFTAFNYLPTRYKANAEQWKVRNFIWAFKDGQEWACNGAANIVATQILKRYGNAAKEMVFACVPASSEQKNRIRYNHFSELVCRATGMQNAFWHITVETDRIAIHEIEKGEQVQRDSILSFDQEFFAGKKVFVFDDIITKGFSYARFASMIESFGACVLGGIFLAKTINL